MYLTLWTYQNKLRCKYFDNIEDAQYKAQALFIGRGIPTEVCKVIKSYDIEVKL